MKFQYAFAFAFGSASVMAHLTGCESGGGGGGVGGGGGAGSGGCIHFDTYCQITGEPEDDQNPCTVDYCDGCGVTQHDPASAGTACDDQSPCTSMGTCQGVICHTPPAIVCNIGEACADGACIQTCIDSAAVVPLSSGMSLGSIASGDVNSDGFADLVIGYLQSGKIRVLFNKGDGTFPDAVDYDTGDVPFSLALADLNGDKALDLVVTNNTGMSVFLNKGDGTFSAAVAHPVGSSQAIWIAAADLDGDGDADVIILDGSNKVHVLLNNGAGALAVMGEYHAGLSLVAAELNGDNKPDLASLNNNGELRLHFNNGDGTFGPPQDQPLFWALEDIAAADFDNDGKTDLAALNALDGYMHVVFNQGNGTFDFRASYPLVAPTRVIATVDMNNDGSVDIVLPNDDKNATMTLMLNKGDGSFSQPFTYSSGHTAGDIVAADLNKDGRSDVAMTNNENNSLTIFFNVCAP